MTVLLAQALLLQGLLPLGLLVWSVRVRGCSRLQVSARALLVVLVVLWLHLALHWLVVPRALSWLWLALALIVLAVTAWRSRHLPLWRRDWRSGALSLACLVMITALGQVFFGWRPVEARVVDLHFPLRDGVYSVANGGGNALLNPHFKTLAQTPAMRQWRGQSYGVDLVAVGPLGWPAPSPLARDPARYRIFGQPVVAPCEGVVRRAVDGLQDLRVPEMDKQNLPGNYVLLACGDVEVVLAHLRQGSIRVQAGQALSRGTLLGEVGNSGNTSQPHLHIHAQTPGTAAAPLSGEPLMLRFEGDFPVRNELFRP